MQKIKNNAVSACKMYKIKQKPEDFIVSEIFSPELKKEGQYAYFRLKKTNYNTIDAVRRIADAIFIPEKNIGFAGSKDRQAVTSQIISVKTSDDRKPSQIQGLKLKDIELEFLGKSDNPVSLGSHEGNQFTITVRNLESAPKKINTKFINYFGDQRFGTNNSEIGKAIVKKDFKKAVELIDRDECREQLEKNKTDYVGALIKIPKKLMTLFVHAYQSEIWNRIAEKVDAEEFSTPGFDISKDKQVAMIIEAELKKDGLSSRDFIIRQIPNIHTEGAVRTKWAEAENLKILEESADELNQGKKKLVLSFSLKKGAYATVFLDSVFRA
jgi:tRNA(Glu) U13 pseudouridine synthase TruD